MLCHHVLQHFCSVDREVKLKVEQAEREVTDSGEAYKCAKEKYSIANEECLNKQREWRSAANKKKRVEEDINLLKREIQKLER